MVHFANEPTEPQSRPPDDAVWGNEVAALEQLGDSIAELAAHLHAATYRLLVMLAEFDRRGGWGGGFRSCAHWLSWRTRLNLGAAREKVRVARALEHLPQVSDTFRRGELSYAVVRAVTRIATPQNESELLQIARHGTASHVEKVVRAWRRVDRLEEQFAERERHRSRHLHLHPDDDGMYVLRARLTPEVGALLERALAAATEVLYRQPNAAQTANEPQTSYAQREADAIGLLAEWAPGGAAPESITLQNETPATDPATRADESDEREMHDASLDDVAIDDRDGQNAAQEDEAPTARDPVNRPNASTSTSRARPAQVSRAERFQVVVHVDAEALRADSETGQAVLADVVVYPAPGGTSTCGSLLGSAIGQALRSTVCRANASRSRAARRSSGRRGAAVARQTSRPARAPSNRAQHEVDELVAMASPRDRRSR